MRRIVTWLLDGLPFDPRSRRALDETLLDWAHEEAGGRSVAAKGLALCGGLLAIVRAIAGSALKESSDVPIGWFSARVVRHAVLPTAVAAVVLAWPLASAFSYYRAAQLIATFAPTLVVMFAPPALVLALAWRADARRVPAAGAALAASCLVPLMTVVILPPATWAFGEIYMRALAEAIGVDRPLSAEAMAWRRLLGIAGGPIPVIVWLVGSGASAGACVWFGAALSARVRLRSVLWLVAVPIVYFAMSGVVSVLIRLVASGPLADAVGTWVFASLVLALAVVIGHRPSPPLELEPERRV